MDFEFLAEIPIDAGHTLEQLTSRFQTIKDGLPELIKNSKDQYARLGITNKADRQIVVLVDTKHRRFAVLDFAGATSKDLSGWQTWSSRTAGRAGLSADIEAGHGNGGKAFMVRGSTTEAFIESCLNGSRNKMGFRNDEPERRFLPGYAKENARRVQDVPDQDPEKRLTMALKSFGLRIADLPKQCSQVFSKRRAFTIVRVDEITEWVNKWPSTIKARAAAVPEELAIHGQAALTVETCSVWVVVDGLQITREPLAVAYPDPLPGFEEIEAIRVPNELEDPRDGEFIKTGDVEKFLRLRTSERQLRMSENTKAINVIRVRNDRNVVGHWPVATLEPRAGSAFIYGELRLPAMTGQHIAGSDRVGFADTPLVRALQAWIAAQIRVLAQNIERSMARETKPEDRERANDALIQFRELMRKFLAADAISGESGSEGRGGKREGLSKEWGSNVDVIVLEPGRTTVAFALGTTVPLDYRCYEQTEKGLIPIRNAALEILLEPLHIVTVSDDGSILGIAPGKTNLWLRDKNSRVESERLEIEVVRCYGVDLVTPTEPLLQGQRIEILHAFNVESGKRDDLLLDATIDDMGLGKISRKGVFTAGHREGVATIRIQYGPSALDHSSLPISIGSEVMPARKRGAGGDIPFILMCGTEAPGMEAYPSDQRTLEGGELYPTVIEEPQFPNIIWLNPRSKEAMRAGRAKGGPTGVRAAGSLNFYQFLALKCFEILKRLWVRQQIKDDRVTEREFSLRFAEAEMECAAFIDAAYELAQNLHQSQ